MSTLINLDLIDFQSSSNPLAFRDSSENWLSFRKIRFANAGDGEYAVVRGIDLSELELHDFPTNNLAFVQCNLEKVSFRDTDFQFNTAFINCSLKNADLTETTAADALFLGCDLTGLKVSPKKPYDQWTSADLDGKDMPTIFNNCTIGKTTRDFLIRNKCIIYESNLDKTQRLNALENINDKLARITTAPILDL